MTVAVLTLTETRAPPEQQEGQVLSAQTDPEKKTTAGTEGVQTNLRPPVVTKINISTRKHAQRKQGENNQLKSRDAYIKSIVQCITNHKDKEC